MSSLVENHHEIVTFKKYVTKNTDNLRKQEGQRTATLDVLGRN